MGDASGWAQAASGVAAIIATWYLARSQQQAAEKAQAEDRKLRAIALATASVVELEDLRIQIEKLHSSAICVQAHNIRGQRDVPEHHLMIATPALLEAHREHVYVLGNVVATAVLLLMAEIVVFDRWVKRCRKVLGSSVLLGQEDADILIGFYDRLRLQLDIAITGMQSIIEQGRRSQTGQYKSWMLGAKRR